MSKRLKILQLSVNPRLYYNSTEHTSYEVQLPSPQGEVVSNKVHLMLEEMQTKSDHNLPPDLKLSSSIVRAELRLAEAKMGR